MSVPISYNDKKQNASVESDIVFSPVSLEMEEERHYNETLLSAGGSEAAGARGSAPGVRPRRVSSPVPYPSPSSSRPLSPGTALFKLETIIYTRTCCTCTVPVKGHSTLEKLR